MKIPDRILGRQLVGVRQARLRTGRGRERVWNVAALVLEDGTELRPLVVETDTGDYYVTFLTVDPTGTSTSCGTTETT